MALFEENVKQQLKGILEQLGEEVQIIYFTQEIECQTCRDGRQFVEEISELSDKLKLIKYNLVTDKEKSKLYNVDKVPAIALADKDGKDTGIRFYGVPGGYEINSFLSALIEVSGKGAEMPPQIDERVKKIKKDVHIQVFVSLGCPYCPDAVATAHRLALENENIIADMVETSQFPHMAIKYNVSGVPKVIINENHEFTGAQPITAFLDMIEQL
ncbi:MAG: thioredoxin family protein [Eubacteriales bacterium]|jgi:glutaredoxin-like protein|nr:thioredoxin family protein [Eubacteriales bacterium]MDD3198529.1 thioredoxin family protein [Eubacteriales bacterium]MDD3504012.1 thioredoxin family protein [Eubacteriales bacterium]MDD4683203.1 thioredoxin family protein [Eubacteriales bacterium]